MARTVTTLDHSQKTEKVCAEAAAISRVFSPLQMRKLSRQEFRYVIAARAAGDIRSNIHPFRISDDFNDFVCVFTGVTPCVQIILLLRKVVVLQQYPVE